MFHQRKEETRRQDSSVPPPAPSCNKNGQDLLPKTMSFRWREALFCPKVLCISNISQHRVNGAGGTPGLTYSSSSGALGTPPTPG